MVRWNGTALKYVMQLAAAANLAPAVSYITA